MKATRFLLLDPQKSYTDTTWYIKMFLLRRLVLRDLRWN